MKMHERRRIEQYLTKELDQLGYAFNRHCPMVGPSLYKDLDCGQLCDKLWHQVDGLCYKPDDVEEIARNSIDIAFLELFLSDRTRSDAK